MREIVLDTETTGLDPAAGHRVVEIGCVELVNTVPTGRVFHRYVDPEREMPAEALAIHGLSAEFLAGHPPFADAADELLAFLGDSPLVIHNAEFDIRFLNAEFGRLGHAPIPLSRVVDTVQVARRKFPGAQASLDALCRRFGIDNSDRALHGALKDADLLARVYLELVGGRQPGLDLAAERAETARAAAGRAFRPPRAHAPSAAEVAAHEAFVAQLADPIWTRYQTPA